MEHSKNTLVPEAATDEPASALDAEAAATSAAGDPDALRCVEPLLSDCLAETFPPGGRKPRHDGFTAEAIAGFLRHLAASGIVEHAAQSVGLSASAAYAFRNRRQGRAFARMWDAILIHRARARLAGENQARAIAGCVSRRIRDGEVVAEYHYPDNRLAMAMLTRLDRLAEREAPNDEHLRALSEDLEDYIDCVAEGGDADAFVEARRPTPAEPEPAPPDSDPDLTTLATLAGCPDYREVNPRRIEVLDLDPGARCGWSADQWVRAYRSGFMHWLHICKADDPLFDPGPEEPLRFAIMADAAVAASAWDSNDPANPLTLRKLGKADEIGTADLDPAAIGDWTDDQLARAWCSGLLDGLPRRFWIDLAEENGPPGGEA